MAELRLFSADSKKGSLVDPGPIIKLSRSNGYRGAHRLARPDFETHPQGLFAVVEKARSKHESLRAVGYVGCTKLVDVGGLLRAHMSPAYVLPEFEMLPEGEVSLPVAMVRRLTAAVFAKTEADICTGQAGALVEPFLGAGYEDPSTRLNPHATPIMTREAWPKPV